jgi:hypothetical protein
VFRGPSRVTFRRQADRLRRLQAALRQLDEVHDAWVAGVRGLGTAALERPVGPAEGPFAERPMAELVLHINREAIHHAAEILLLRDLYRSTRT